MKIADLQVDGFGVWKGLTVDAFSENMTVFYGHNEAGKTTLMQFQKFTSSTSFIPLEAQLNSIFRLLTTELRIGGLF